MYRDIYSITIMKKNLIYILIFSLPSLAFGQHWKEIPLPATYHEVTPYFLDENVGFIFEGYSGLAKLYRTTDGGMNWKSLPFFDSLGPDYVIRQIFFESSNKGYAAGGAGIYETEDTGNTWRSIYPEKIFFNSVYAFGGKIFAYGGESATWDALIETENGGGTWNTILPPTYYHTPPDVDNPLMPYVFGNNDGTVFSEKVIPPGNLSLTFSTNNGKDWTTTPMDIAKKTFTAGLFSFPHSNELLRTCDDLRELPDNNKDVYFIMHSSDLGMHWDTVFHPVEIGAWIAGNACVQYVSKSDQTGVHGVYRSTDAGHNWKYISGPDFTELDDVDFHNISVVGGGAVVYAGDVNYGSIDKLWKTTDGGDGTLSPTNSGGASSFHFSSSRIINDSLNIIIHLPIYSHQSATMNDVDMIMHYPSTGSLKYLNGFTYNGKSIDVAGSQWSGRAELHFAAADLNAAPDSLIGYANFLWTPYEYECDEIIFDSIDTHSSEAPCSSSATALPFKGIIGSYKTCGASAVAEIQTTIADFSIHPNPATNNIEIAVTRNIGKLRYELFDALGASRKNGSTSEASFQIDVSELAAGNYYLRISGAGGMPVTKRVVVVK